MNNSRLLVSFLIIISVISADQITKLLVISNLEFGQPLEITGFFNLLLVSNKGIAFSLLSSYGVIGRFVLSAISIIAVLFMARYILKEDSCFYKTICFSFILAGAIGNLIDRVVNGSVIDFIQVHYLSNYWPVFNIADTFITIGVILLLSNIIIHDHKDCDHHHCK